MGKKLLSDKELFNLSVFAFGLQFANMLQLSNMSSLYKFLGAASSDLPYLWLAAPVSGLIMQPVIGQLSDNTCTRFGRRRPYIFFWGIMAVIGFCVLPVSTNIIMAAVCLWIIGFSINGCTEALRALIGDITPNQQKARAFALQTVFAGIGAGFATATPYLIKHIAPVSWKIFHFNNIPYSLQLAFFLSAIILLLSMAWTLGTIEERPPPHPGLIANIRRTRKCGNIKKLYQFMSELSLNIKCIPNVIRKFMIIQFFTWVGLFAMWLYFILGLAQYVYGLPIDADVVHNQYYAAILEESTIQSGLYFSIYQWVSVIYAVLLPALAEKYSLKLLHAIALIIGAISIIACGATKSEQVFVVGMAGVGIMWGSIMTLPYAIVSAELPKSKMGVYLGIFNVSVTLPQIIAGFIWGPLHTKIFAGHAMDVVRFGGFLILTGGLLMLGQSLRNRHKPK